MSYDSTTAQLLHRYREEELARTLERHRREAERTPRARDQRRRSRWAWPARLHVAGRLS